MSKETKEFEIRRRLYIEIFGVEDAEKRERITELLDLYRAELSAR